MSCHAMISLSILSKDDDGVTSNIGGKKHSQGKERHALGGTVPIYPIRSITMIIMFVSLALTDENAVRALSSTVIILRKTSSFLHVSVALAVDFEFYVFHNAQ